MEPSGKTKTELEEQKLQQEILKLKKETEKVELELFELKKPHWRRPATVAAFLPTFVAILSLIIFASNGFFSVESKRIENQREKAQSSLDSLNVQKKRIEIAQTKQRAKYVADSAMYHDKLQKSESAFHQKEGEWSTMAEYAGALQVEVKKLTQKLSALRDSVRNGK